MFIFLLILLAGCSAPAQQEEVYEESEEEIVEEKNDPLENILSARRAKNWQPNLYQLFMKQQTPLIPDNVEIAIKEFEYARLYSIEANFEVIVLGGVDIFDPQYLNSGAVHFPETDFPSTKPGNTVIGGHRTNPNHFFYLPDLNPGDLIYLETGGFLFVYETLWQELTDKYDWTRIDEKPDYPALTLQTCDPGYVLNAPNRIFVRAKLVSIEYMQ